MTEWNMPNVEMSKYYLNLIDKFFLYICKNTL